MAGNKKLTQRIKIIAHMKKYGSITPKDAFTLYHIYRLSARIKELKEDYAIKSEIEYGVDEDGNKTKWARYTLMTEEMLKGEE